jgi:hypothetical protein
MGRAWTLRPLVPAGVTTDVVQGAEFAPSNMLNDYLGVVYRSPPVGLVTITVDLGANPAPVDALLLFGCTDAKAHWDMDVLASNAADFSAPVHASNGLFLAGAEFPLHGRGVGFREIAGGLVQARYWRLAIYMYGGGQLTVGRLVMGARLQLERNFAFGAAFGVRDLGNVQFSTSGVLLRRRAAKLRTLGLTFPSVRRDEVEARVQPLIEQAAGQEPIALCIDPDPHAQRQKRCYFGNLIGDLGTIWTRASGFEWRANLVDLVPIPKAS